MKIKNYKTICTPCRAVIRATIKALYIKFNTELNKIATAKR